MEEKPTIKKELLFVYNASLNPLKLVDDFFSEIIPNRVTNCQLCNITYGLAFKKTKWKEYVNTLPYPSAFCLKPSFLKRFPSSTIKSFPSIVLLEKDQIALELVSAEAFENINTLEELINILELKLHNL